MALTPEQRAQIVQELRDADAASPTETPTKLSPEERQRTIDELRASDEQPSLTETGTVTKAQRGLGYLVSSPEEQQKLDIAQQMSNKTPISSSEAFMSSVELPIVGRHIPNLGGPALESGIQALGGEGAIPGTQTWEESRNILDKYKKLRGAEAREQFPVATTAGEMAPWLLMPTPGAPVALTSKIAPAVSKVAPAAVGKSAQYLAEMAGRVGGMAGLTAAEEVSKTGKIGEETETAAKIGGGLEAAALGLKGAGKLGKGAVDLYGRMRGFSGKELDLYRAAPQELLSRNMDSLVKIYSDEALTLGKEAQKLADEGADAARITEARKAFVSKIKEEQDEATRILESSQAAAKETEASNKAMRTLQSSEAVGSKREKIQQLREQASDLLKKAEEETKQPYLTAKTRKVSEAEGQVLKDTFDKAKDQIKTLGKEQGEILKQSGVSFSPEELEQAFTAISDKYAVKGPTGEVIRDAEHKALNKFNELYIKPFKDAGATIPPETVARIRQKIDDVAYGSAGKEQEFASIPEAALREMRNSINTIVDSKIPEYAAKRSALAEAYQIHDSLVDSFGTKAGEFSKQLSKVEGKYSKPLQDILDRAGEKFGTDIGKVARDYAKEKGLTAVEAKKLVEETQSYKKLMGEATEAGRQAERLGGEIKAGQRAKTFAEQARTTELSKARRLEKETLAAKNRSEIKQYTNELNNAKDKQQFIESQRNEIVNKAAERGYSEAAIGDLAKAQGEIEPLLKAGFIGAEPSVATVTRMKQLTKEDPRIMREIEELGVKLKLAKKEQFDTSFFGLAGVAKALLPVKRVLGLEDKISSLAGRKLTPEERAWIHKSLFMSMQNATED